MKTTVLLIFFAASQLLDGEEPPKSQPVPAIQSGWEAFRKGMLKPEKLKANPKADKFAKQAAERVEDLWIKPFCLELAAGFGHMDNERIIAAVEKLTVIKTDRDNDPKSGKGWAWLEPLMSAPTYGLDPFGKIDRLQSIAKIRKTTDSMVAGGTSPSEILQFAKATAERKVVVGMPEAMAVMSWGKPKSINRSSSGPDQWVYETGNYLYFENGLLKSWQTSE